jgi:hypothetical protein
MSSFPAYAQMIRLIHSLHIASPFSFDRDARAVCARVAKSLKEWQRAGVYGDGFSQWVGKLNILFGLLCVILHVADAVGGYVALHYPKFALTPDLSNFIDCRTGSIAAPVPYQLDPLQPQTDSP